MANHDKDPLDDFIAFCEENMILIGAAFASIMMLILVVTYYRGVKEEQVASSSPGLAAVTPSQESKQQEKKFNIEMTATVMARALFALPKAERLRLLNVPAHLEGFVEASSTVELGGELYLFMMYIMEKCPSIRPSALGPKTLGSLAKKAEENDTDYVNDVMNYLDAKVKDCGIPPKVRSVILMQMGKSLYLKDELEYGPMKAVCETCVVQLTPSICAECGRAISRTCQQGIAGLIGNN